ncbi:hypothetical protein IWQ62_003898, partial [Dispira parvispora]
MEELPASKIPQLVKQKSLTTSGTPGGIYWHDQIFGAFLPFDEEQIPTFVDEFEKYAEARNITDGMKRLYLKQFLPKKLYTEIKDIFASDEPWSSIRKFLLNYGEIEKENRQKVQVKKLRSLVKKKKVKKYTLTRFLLYYEQYAERCKAISDEEKCKIVMKAMPK